MSCYRFFCFHIINLKFREKIILCTTNRLDADQPFQLPPINFCPAVTLKKNASVWFTAPGYTRSKWQNVYDLISRDEVQITISLSQVSRSIYSDLCDRFRKIQIKSMRLINVLRSQTHLERKQRNMESNEIVSIIPSSLAYANPPEASNGNYPGYITSHPYLIV